MRRLQTLRGRHDQSDQDHRDAAHKDDRTPCCSSIHRYPSSRDDLSASRKDQTPYRAHVNCM